MNKTAKIVIITIVVIFLLSMAFRWVGTQGFMAGKNSDPDTGSGNSEPSLSSIMGKGYSEEEARQILDSIKAGGNPGY